MFSIQSRAMLPEEDKTTLQQMLFAQALHDPSTIPATSALFRGNPTRNQRQLARYCDSVFSNWEKALATTFPVLKALVGDAFFSGLARAYSHVHPSNTGDLNGYGIHLPHFLAHFKPAKDYPYFEDMAHLEWAIHCAHYAADALSISPEDMAEQNPESLEQRLFTLHPACTVFQSSWAIGTLWLAHQLDSDIRFPETIHTVEYILVFRPQWHPKIRIIQAVEYQALLKLIAPCGLSRALETVPAQKIAALFEQWLVDKLLIDVINQKTVHNS